MTVILGLAYVVLTLILGRIVYTDIRYRYIGNEDVLFTLFSIFAVRFTDISHLSYSTAMLVFIFGVFLWHFGVCGAGDIKLITVLTLAVDGQWFLLCLVSMLLLGGVLAIALCLWGRLSSNGAPYTKGVPYGVPIVVSFGFGIVLTLLPS
ncbi:prepilin peptidase [Vibrio zhugei]|uniref:prepilin peptidase n=1 Tax=Vibrio zhugei TaxID=2479546 RepID=UPI000F0B607A|nr:prepilin peptidase [Vibrio zhugei]